jgi:gliding motility-associated-like protein
MKKLLQIIVASLFIFFAQSKAHACHALAVQNYNLTVVAGAVEVDASSTQPTCGCGVYWLDVEIRCIGEAFDAGPFDPTQYLSLSNYPYFQSATMLKPQCNVQAYPTVTIPYGSLCPGIDYQVRVRENNNGNGGPWSNALTFTVPGTIDPLVANVNASNVNLCIGDCTNITASVIGGCGLAPLYSWNTGQTTPTINVCPAVTTTYTVTITEQCSNLTTTESITVFVVPTPIAGTATANPTTVCAGETTNLTLAGSDGNIQWESAPNSGGPWTPVAGATTINETSPPINADICYRAVVSGCGPSDISNIVCVTVAPAPTVTVSNETICDGETTTLTTTVNPGGGTYLWTPTNQTTADLTNVSPAATTTYSVEYTLNGCTVTETGTVTVNPQPTTLALAGSTICFGDNATITATPDFAGGNYTWTPNVSTGNTATVSPAVGINTYTVDYDLNGCTYSESVDITVNPVPTVTITNQEICNGEQATLTATPDIGGGTYLWTPNGETVDNISYSPNATTNYGVTYSLNGCNATDNGDIIVHPNPTANFDFVNECFGTDINMNSTSNVAAGTIQTFEWDIEDDGIVDYSTNGINHSYPSDGTYDVTLYVETGEGCSDQITQTVESYPVANVDFSATPLCLGSPTDFTDLTSFTNGGTIDTWLWDFDDNNNTSTQQNPQNTYPSAGIYDVSLTVTTDNGCVSSLNQNVEIYALPTADFTVDDECYDEDISFQNTSLGNATNFEWDFDDGSPLNNLENPSHQYNNAGIYNVTLIISTDDGCADTVTNTASAYALPQADFTVDPTCLNNASNFIDASNVTPVDGDVLTNWSWDFGDGNTSTNQNPSNTYTGENVYNVSLTVTTNHGCAHTFTSDATVWPLPQVDFSPIDVCLEQATEYQDQSTISNQNTTNSVTGWAWDFGDGAGTSVQQNPIYTYLTDGTFNATLTATSNNGCVNDTTKVVTVHPKPVASFSGQNLTGCSPVCFDISSTSTLNSPGTIVDYQWNFSDGSSYTSTTPDLQDCFENNSGNTQFYGVELIVTSDQGCVDDHSEANYIEVYHNPIAGFSYSPETVDILDPSVEINNSSQYADNYNWNVTDYGTSTDYSPIFEWAPEPDSQFIQLIVSTNEGCFDTANAVVNILDRLILYVPNTFTPDFDDYNESFQPIFTSGFDPFNFNMKIFNRWGEVVFESNDASIGWDGTYGADNNKLVRDGTYVWKIEFKETSIDKRHVIKGHVNVLK